MRRQLWYRYCNGLTRAVLDCMQLRPHVVFQTIASIMAHLLKDLMYKVTGCTLSRVHSVGVKKRTKKECRLLPELKTHCTPTARGEPCMP